MIFPTLFKLSSIYIPIHILRQKKFRSWISKSELKHNQYKYNPPFHPNIVLNHAPYWLKTFLFSDVILPCLQTHVITYTACQTKKKFSFYIPLFTLMLVDRGDTLSQEISIGGHGTIEIWHYF